MSENTERLNRASTTLATMLDYLNLDATVKGEEKNGRIVLLTTSDDAGRIIGKNGQSLQSLELLLNRMSTKNDIECPWISINVDGYSRGSSDRPFKKNDFREKSKFPERGRQPSKSFKSDEDSENITLQTLDAAKEVKRWGESVTLPPMNSHDRRLVHMALKDDSEIKTESNTVNGSDRLKSVVISLNEK
jgi:spoIIIJ-associated protein